MRRGRIPTQEAQRREAPEHKTRVVVTGIGPLVSIGMGKDKFWENLLAGKTNVVLQDDWVGNEKWTSFYIHKLEHFDVNDFRLEKSILEEIKIWKDGKEDPDLFYLMAAVKLALEDSCLKYDKENNEIGLFVAHENPGLENFFTKVLNDAHGFLDGTSRNGRTKSKKDFFEALYESSIKSGYDLQTFMPLFFIGKMFGLHGFSLFVNNACASGSYAIEAASRYLQKGNAKVAVIAAGDRPVYSYKYLWFRKLGFYADDGKIKPFSKERNGMVFGDGASAIVLEELEHARKRGATIYGEYLGGGFSSEGWKVTLPAVQSTYYQEAIKGALIQSQVQKEEIDLLNVHGVGVGITDEYEAKAVTAVFGKNPRRPFVNAFKPYVGHNLGGSALLESIILLLSLHHNIILPTLNCEPIDQKLGIQLVTKPVLTELKTSLKICCAFAGYNAATVFRKVMPK